MILTNTKNLKDRKKSLQIIKYLLEMKVIKEIISIGITIENRNMFQKTKGYNNNQIKMNPLKKRNQSVT